MTDTFEIADSVRFRFVLDLISLEHDLNGQRHAWKLTPERVAKLLVWLIRRQHVADDEIG
jgi:hypothetical protein